MKIQVRQTDYSAFVADPDWEEEDYTPQSEIQITNQELPRLLDCLLYNKMYRVLEEGQTQLAVYEVDGEEKPTQRFYNLENWDYKPEGRVEYILPILTDESNKTVHLYEINITKLDSDFFRGLERILKILPNIILFDGRPRQLFTDLKKLKKYDPNTHYWIHCDPKTNLSKWKNIKVMATVGPGVNLYDWIVMMNPTQDKVLPYFLEQGAIKHDMYWGEGIQPPKENEIKKVNLDNLGSDLEFLKVLAEKITTATKNYTLNNVLLAMMSAISMAAQPRVSYNPEGIESKGQLIFCSVCSVLVGESGTGKSQLMNLLAAHPLKKALVRNQKASKEIQKEAPPNPLEIQNRPKEQDPSSSPIDKTYKGISTSMTATAEGIIDATKKHQVYCMVLDEGEYLHGKKASMSATASTVYVNLWDGCCPANITRSGLAEGRDSESQFIRFSYLIGLQPSRMHEVFSDEDSANGGYMGRMLVSHMPPRPRREKREFFRDEEIRDTKEYSKYEEILINMLAEKSLHEQIHLPFEVEQIFMGFREKMEQRRIENYDNETYENIVMTTTIDRASQKAQRLYVALETFRRWAGTPNQFLNGNISAQNKINRELAIFCCEYIESLVDEMERYISADYTNSPLTMMIDDLKKTFKNLQNQNKLVDGRLTNALLQRFGATSRKLRSDQIRDLLQTLESLNYIRLDVSRKNQISIDINPQLLKNGG